MWECFPYNLGNFPKNQLSLYLKSRDMKSYFKLKIVKNIGYVTLLYHHKNGGIELSSGIKCTKNNWGDGHKPNPIKKSDADYINKNEVLRLFMVDVERAVFNLQTNNIAPFASALKMELKKMKEDMYFESKIKVVKDRYPVLFVLKKYVENEISKVTSYSRSIKFRMSLITEYIKSDYGVDLDFRDINDLLFQNLQNFLVSKNYSNNTIAKIISQFRQFLRWARKNGYVSEVYLDYKTSLTTKFKTIIVLEEPQIKKLYDFSDFDFKTKKKDEDGNPIYTKYYKDWPNTGYLISDEKLSTIKDEKGYAVRDNKGKIVGAVSKGEFNTFTVYEVTKDMLLFSVATALRYSDVVRLKVSDFDYNNRLFKVFQKKTSLSVSIVENELSKKIWRKYTFGKSESQYVFPMSCKPNDVTRQHYLSKVNLHLKQIGEEVGLKNLVEYIKMSGKEVDKGKLPLYSMLSFHIGRRTHATLANKKGVDEFTIARQLGHTANSVTAQYVGSSVEKLKTMFDFLIKENSKIEKANSKESTLEESLKHDISVLQKLLENGGISETLYEKRVEILLDKYGFK